MSTTCEVAFEPLAFDGSNYSSWHSNVLIAPKVLGPTVEGIMVASILPEDETCVLPKELEKKRLNAVVTNLLCSCVCSELKHLILMSKGISKDAHLIWKLLFGIAHIKWDEVESDDDDDDEPVEMCPTTSTTTTNHQTSTLKEEGDKRSKGRVSLGEGVIPPSRGGLTAPNREASTFYDEGACLVAKKKSKKKRQTKAAKSQKIEDSSYPTRELELLKSELASLVCKNELLANKYDHDIKSFSYRTKIEEEANDVLEAQLAKLTSEHMTLQATHKELECSYEKLVDSYASLEIAHEVVLSSVKFLQPLTPICTCSLINNEFACTKPCCSQASQSSIEHVLVESCDDLIAQENDELKKEVEKLKRDLYVLKEESQVQPPQNNRDDVVKKLEKGPTVTSSTLQQHIKINKSKIQEKEKGHATSHCPTKIKAQETISKKRRRSTRTRLCYVCEEKGHSAADCTQVSSTDQGRSDRPQGG
jgi:hypothetical protein